MPNFINLRNISKSNKEIKIVPRDGGSTVQFLNEQPSKYITGEDGSISFVLATERNDRFTFVEVESKLNGGITLGTVETPNESRLNQSVMLAGYNPNYDSEQVWLQNYDAAQMGLGMLIFKGPYLYDEPTDYFRTTHHTWLTNLSKTAKVRLVGNVLLETPDEGEPQEKLKYGKGVATQQFGEPLLTNGSFSMSPDNQEWEVLLGTNDTPSLSEVTVIAKLGLEPDETLTKTFGLKMIYVNSEGEETPIEYMHEFTKPDVETSWYAAFNIDEFKDGLYDYLDNNYPEVFTTYNYDGPFKINLDYSMISPLMDNTNPRPGNPWPTNPGDNSEPEPIEDGEGNDGEIIELPPESQLWGDALYVQITANPSSLYSNDTRLSIFDECLSVRLKVLIDHDTDDFVNLGVNNMTEGYIFANEDCASFDVVSEIYNGVTTEPPAE